MRKSIFKISAIILMFPGMMGCDRSNNGYDASGTFEAEETIISAQVTGEIVQLNINEGEQLKKGEVVGYIDTTQLNLKREQLESQIRAVLSRNPEASAQLSSLEQQIKHANRELKRIENLYNGGAATKKQLDDAQSQLAVLESQLNALQSTLAITKSSLYAETTPLQAQIAQIEDQISKSMIVNPLDGTILTQYARANEMAVAGKPLYKIADISNLILRAYITGNQLSDIKLNQEVTVLIELANGSKEYKGRVTWISAKAEFTPKTIQTKEERANLVYAVKISVPNDGFLKIGMYADVKL